MGEKRQFLGGSGHNIPSFEIFTSPDWRGARGTYFCDLPSYRSGNRVSGIKLEFQNGKVVKASAKEGQDFLRSILAIDLGARGIGEFSLTDRRFSRIDKFMKPGKDLDEWKKSGAQYVIAARASNPGKMWTLSATVYEATSGQPVLEKYYRGDISTVRKAAHMFSDEVVNRLTGKAGIATTRIVFANDNTGNKEIYTVDYDGENLIRLTNDKSIALLPKWSPDGTKIYYTTYRYRNPDMVVVHVRRHGLRAEALAAAGFVLVGRANVNAVLARCRKTLTAVCGISAHNAYSQILCHVFRNGHELRDDGGVFGLGVLTRAENVEVTQRHGFKTEIFSPHHAVVFCGELAYCIRGDRRRGEVFFFGENLAFAVGRA